MLAYIDALEEYLEYLLHRMKRNSRNSSIPPSQDPPDQEKKRKRRSGKRPGGQEGHLGASRPLEKPDRVEVRRPGFCNRCGTSIPNDAPLVGTPLIKQQRELVEKPTEVVQREYWECNCPLCGHRNRAVPASGEDQCLGPRLQAVAVFMNGVCHTSISKIASFFTEVFDTPVSRATLWGIRPKVAESLQYSTACVYQEVRVAPVKGMDETGWKHAGKREYLWTIATEAAAFYAILPTRSRQAAVALLGKDPVGLIMTDGYAVYDFIPEDQHGRCTAHLKRDFEDLAESTVAERVEFGTRGLAILASLFLVVQQAKAGLLSAWQLWEALQPVKQRMGKLLTRGEFGTDPFLQGFSMRFRKNWKSWFLFPENGLDATNNSSERALRPGVLWRWISMGTRSEEGLSFVMRMMTAAETAKRRGRRLMPFLTHLLRCYHRGITSPPLSITTYPTGGGGT